jgi:hypothetical protein
MCKNVAILSGNSGTEYISLDTTGRKKKRSVVPKFHDADDRRPSNVPSTSSTWVWSTREEEERQLGDPRK